MLGWFKKPKHAESMVSIPIRPEVTAAFAVYFAPTDATLPDEAALGLAGSWWREEHLRDPLRQAVAAFHDRGLVSVRVDPVDKLPFPQPPVELLRYTGLGELEERVFGAARHAVLIGCGDLNAPPRAGLWSALTMGLGVAAQLDGVIFDPDALRIVSRKAAVGWFTESGAIAASQHILVPFSVGHEGGLGWMTTRGLQKFGLPDLELRDVPPNLVRLSVLMNSVAQLLVDTTLRRTVESDGMATMIEVPGQISLDDALVARAHGGSAPSDARLGSPVQVGLRFDTTDRAHDSPPMIRLMPPRGEVDPGIWLNAIATRLLSGSDDIRTVRTRSVSMLEAHERAMSELPYAKARFTAGLKLGETLFVKRGFETASGSEEFLWLVVTRWSGNRLIAQVANEPREVPELRLGQTVAVEEASLFDWMIRLSHDRYEGGYTSQVAVREGLG